MNLEMQVLNVKTQLARRNVFEAGVRSCARDKRRAVRQERSRPPLAALGCPQEEAGRCAIRLHNKSAIVRSAPSLGLPE
jgi:hypothetical protein